jgi:hypothetical protein
LGRVRAHHDKLAMPWDHCICNVANLVGTSSPYRLLAAAARYEHLSRSTRTLRPAEPPPVAHMPAMQGWAHQSAAHWLAFPLRNAAGSAVSSPSVIILTHEFSPYHGGVGTYCAEIGKAADAIGFDVTVAAPSYGEDNAALDATFPFSVQRFEARAYSALRLLLLAKLIMQSCAKFDIVILADWPFIIAARLLIWKDLSKRVRVILHGTDALLLAQGRVPRVLAAGRVLERVHKVIANSRYTLTDAPRCDPR